MLPTPRARSSPVRLLGAALMMLAAAVVAVTLPASPANAATIIVTDCLTDVAGPVHALPPQPAGYFILSVGRNDTRCLNRPPIDAYGNNSYSYATGPLQGQVCKGLTQVSTGQFRVPDGYTIISEFFTSTCDFTHQTNGQVNAAFLRCDTCTSIGAGFNAASYGRSAVLPATESFAGFAPLSSAVAFGRNITTTPATHEGRDCVTTLGNRRLEIVSPDGSGRFACLTAVTVSQINFYTDVAIPSARDDDGRLQLRNANNQMMASSNTPIRRTQPGIFTVNAQGTGLPSGYLVRTHDGVQTVEPLSNPIRLGGDQVVLVLYGTGVRNHNPARPISLRMTGPGVDYYAGVQYYGEAPDFGFKGVDQINVPLPNHITGDITFYLSLDDSGAAPEEARWSQPLSMQIVA